MVNRFLSSLLFLATVNTGIVQAQVVPDGTLPTVVEQLENMRKITGGERVGDNLFHSFEEFSIPEGIEAIFENGLDIENIFTRITGSDISVIDGLLKTAGGANFFLINPNGIVFGENAQLDVGGSFIATTANRIEFADGTNFATRGDEPKVTLTISVPIGLRLDGNNGSITVNGSGNQIINDSTFAPIEFSERPQGISVNDGNTLALVGNGIDFNGGVITTEGGNIYLTSVSSGKVGITQQLDWSWRGNPADPLVQSEKGLALIDDDVINYQDINLDRQSLVDASGEKVGNISVIGQNINLNDASVILSQNQGDLASGSSGLIDIEAIESINLSGNSPDGDIASVIRTETFNNAEKGANINLDAPQLNLQDEARIQAFTFSDANGGNINIQTLRAINLDNSFINASTRGKGDAGNLNLSTSQLRLTNVGIISSSSIGTNDGNGGEITINADFIDISGTSTSFRTNISTSSFTLGNAGNLTINTKQLRIADGASVSSSSFNNGNAGNLTINASEIINLSGKSQTFQGSGNSESTIRTAVQIGRGDNLPAVPSGNSGNLIINTPSLLVNEQAVITVENQGTGSAGRLTINADNLNIDKAGRITAAASSGLGGNIEVNTQNLNISNNSQITAVADGQEDGGNITINTTNLTAKKNNQITASANEGDGGNIILNADSVSLNDRDEISAASSSGDGGNININTDILTALEQSKITANSISGDGGNITINSRGYFVSEDSVVSASSEFGQTGTININSLENNFQQDLEESEVEIAIIPDFFIPRCANPDRAYLSLFPGDVLRPSPDHYYSYPSQTDSEVVLQEPEYQEKLERIVQRYESRLESEPEPEPEIEEPEPESESGLIWQPGDPMINATEIVETEDGEVFLVPPAEKQEFLRLLRCGKSFN